MGVCIFSTFPPSLLRDGKVTCHTRVSPDGELPQMTRVHVVGRLVKLSKCIKGEGNRKEHM